MPGLVVSDANVIIDMVDGDVLRQFFRMPLEICVPDLLYAAELEPYIPDLSALGLQVRPLSPETIQYVDELGTRGIALPSINDQLALGLAKQERCTLLTGDQMLRRLAEAEGIAVHGTVWLMNEMISHRLVTPASAVRHLRLMLRNGSRLPLREIRRMLKRHGRVFSP